MPEAAVNKHHSLKAREHKIWRAWQVATVKAEAEAARMQAAAQQQLGFRVLAVDAAHVESPLLCRQNICHTMLPRS
jgi:hypothetical protein